MTKGKHLFCDGWKFTLTEPDSTTATLDNATWYNVEIPHDWLIGDTNNLYASGCGWYKKTFTADLSDNSAYIICFDGVYMDTTVYINGKIAGEWKYGYTSFSFNITDFLCNGTNEVLVRVNHKSPNTRWYSGAGIFRNVYLRITSPVHIEENGVYISTKHCGGSEGAHSKWKLFIDTAISENYEGNVKHTVKDAEGKICLELERRVCGNGDKASIYLENPMLWSPDSPNLYYVTTELSDKDGNVIDSVSNRFGFRHFEYTSDKGFFVNGKHAKLNGVCLHHDLGALGSAVNYDATRRQLEIMRGMGVNAIRTSHNPPSRELMELCDTMGFFVDSEFLDMWEIPKTEFDYARFLPEWYKKDVNAWISRDRNCPSVIMWSIGNEIPDTHKDEHGLEIAKMLSEEVKKYDYRQNALPTIGSNYMPWENAQKVADYLKLSGYNYSERLYNEHHEKHPDWVIYGSETASTVRSRGIYHFPLSSAMLTHDDMQCSDLGNSVVGWGASPEKSLLADRNAKFSLGQFVWTGFDYIGEPTPYSSKNSYFGIVDTSGFPKASYWLYKSIWDKNAKPFLKVIPHMDYNENQLIDIIAFTNLPVVRLFYGKKMSDPIVIDNVNSDTLYGKWQIKNIPSEKVYVRAYNSIDDDVKQYVLEEKLPRFSDAVSIKLTSDKNEIKADGRSLAFIEINVTDKDGNEVLNANNRVKITVSGAGRLIGTDNGDSTDYESYRSSSRKLFSGKLLAMVGSTLQSGEIKITAESNGIEKAELIINAVPCEKPEGISVETENLFPVIRGVESDEIPIRKIELRPIDKQELSENNKTAQVAVKILPENATYSDIDFVCCGNNGVEINYAKLKSYENGIAVIEALGDGDFRLRAFAKNGSDMPKIISELEYSVSGLGDATKNAYKFTAACLFDAGNVKLNCIERGALGGFSGETKIAYKNVDFGIGADKITIHVGNCGGGEKIPVEIYEGDMNGENRLIGCFGISHNGGWDRAYPETFDLPEILSGTKDIFVVIKQNCIFGGFEFIKHERAFALNHVGYCDELYGDDYTVNGEKIEKIGNNVVILFNDMNFTVPATKITVCGKTPLDCCAIQLRIDDENGVQTTQLLQFPHADEYTEVTFPLEAISGSNNKISFVFMPGTKFDMDWFRME